MYTYVDSKLADAWKTVVADAAICKVGEIFYDKKTA